MCVQFSMQEEDIHENTNGKCHAFTFQYCKRNITLKTTLPSIIRVHFQSTNTQFCNVGIHVPHKIIEHTRAKDGIMLKLSITSVT
jgi:hypothetical protein